MSRFNTLILLLVLFIYLTLASGSAKHGYRVGSKVDLLYNKIESDQTQLPYTYCDLKFTCVDGEKPIPLSFDEILRGDRPYLSHYSLTFGKDVSCSNLYTVKVRKDSLEQADKLIRQEYVVYWLVDGLPGATTFVSELKKKRLYRAGFPLGFVKDGISYLNNHVMLVIRYHKVKKVSDTYNIVGFEVYPKSINRECPLTSSDDAKLSIMKEKEVKNDEMYLLPYTYSVYWREEPNVAYDSRWNLYYESETDSSHKIHWLSIINSFVLLLLLSLIVAIVFLRILKYDIQSHTSLPVSEFEFHGSWKSLSGHVNERPKSPLFLSLLVSSGIQVLITALIICFVLVLELHLNIKLFRRESFDRKQGAFYSLAIFFFVISGFIPSFAGIILHKVFNNGYINNAYPRKKMVSLSLLFTGFLPITVLSVVLFLNFFSFVKRASTALPFGTIISLIFCFLVFQLPLGLFGGYRGNGLKFDRKSLLFSSTDEKITEKPPTKKLTALRWVLNPILGTFLFGFVPFIIVYVEMLFIFNSVWLEKTTFYYLFGFLLLTVIILVVFIVEITIIVIYLSLSFFHYPHWQWLSFRVGSSVAWYIFAYSCYYYVFLLNIKDFISCLLYFINMLMICAIIGIACGSVGVLTGLFFIKKIYGAVKMD